MPLVLLFGLLLLGLLTGATLHAETATVATTNLTATALPVTVPAALPAAQPVVLNTNLPDTGASVFRVIGAMILVIAIFFAGVWLFRNWQRISNKGKGGARLNLIEVKSLGQRQSLFVVGYQEQRMLLAASPSGITLLTQLPPEKAAPEVETSTAAATDSRMSFAEAFQQVLSRKS